MSNLKATNPKDGIGAAKVPLHLLSPIAKAEWALAQFVGDCKYQQWNWRAGGILLSVYIAAAERHLDGFKSGETLDPDDLSNHLGNVMACCAIMLDAIAAGVAVDDRAPVVDMRPTYKYVEERMAQARLRYSHIPRNPYTILNTVVKPLQIESA